MATALIKKCKEVFARAKAEVEELVRNFGQQQSQQTSTRNTRPSKTSVAASDSPDRAVSIVNKYVAAMELLLNQVVQEVTGDGSDATNPSSSSSSSAPAENRGSSSSSTSRPPPPPSNPDEPQYLQEARHKLVELEAQQDAASNKLEATGGNDMQLKQQLDDTIRSVSEQHTLIATLARKATRASTLRKQPEQHPKYADSRSPNTNRKRKTPPKSNENVCKKQTAANKKEHDSKKELQSESNTDTEEEEEAEAEEEEEGSDEEEQGEEHDDDVDTDDEEDEQKKKERLEDSSIIPKSTEQWRRRLLHTANYFTQRQENELLQQKKTVIVCTDVEKMRMDETIELCNNPGLDIFDVEKDIFCAAVHHSYLSRHSDKAKAQTHSSWMALAMLVARWDEEITFQYYKQQRKTPKNSSKLKKMPDTDRGKHKKRLEQLVSRYFMQKWDGIYKRLLRYGRVLRGTVTFQRKNGELIFDREGGLCDDALAVLPRLIHPPANTVTQLNNLDKFQEAVKPIQPDQWRVVRNEVCPPKGDDKGDVEDHQTDPEGVSAEELSPPRDNSNGIPPQDEEPKAALPPPSIDSNVPAPGPIDPVIPAPLDTTALEAFAEQEDDPAITAALKESDNRTLITINNVPFTVNSLKKLHDDWLDDESINVYVELINQRTKHAIAINVVGAPRAVCMNTFFFKKMSKLDPNGKRTSVDTEAAKQWFSKAIPPTLKEVQLLIIPAHVHGSHWSLVAIHFEQKYCAFFDSVGGSDTEFLSVTKDCVLANRDVLGLGDSIQEWLPDAPCKTAMEVLGEQYVPQSNGLDCGVFVLKWAECISANRDILGEHFEPKAIQTSRRRIATQIVRGYLDAPEEKTQSVIVVPAASIPPVKPGKPEASGEDDDTKETENGSVGSSNNNMENRGTATTTRRPNKRTSNVRQLPQKQPTQLRPKRQKPPSQDNAEEDDDDGQQQSPPKTTPSNDMDSVEKKSDSDSSEEEDGGDDDDGEGAKTPLSSPAATRFTSQSATREDKIPVTLPNTPRTRSSSLSSSSGKVGSNDKRRVVFITSK